MNLATVQLIPRAQLSAAGGLFDPFQRKHVLVKMFGFALKVWWHRNIHMIQLDYTNRHKLNDLLRLSGKFSNAIQ
jgi:hypothetical protein